MLRETVTTYQRTTSYAADVHPTTQTEIESATATLLMAFSTDPVARWVYPNPGDYVHYFPKFIHAFAGRSFSRGTAFVTGDLRGAALWLPPNVGPDEEPLLELFEVSAADTIKPDLFEVLAVMETYHPREPHWYLPMLGVDSGRQGSGVGSALLAATLFQCDSDRLPAYLESTNPRNLSLYERFGFETIGTIQCGDSPPMFPMVRQPQ